MAAQFGGWRAESRVWIYEETEKNVLFLPSLSSPHPLIRERRPLSPRARDRKRRDDSFLRPDRHLVRARDTTALKYTPPSTRLSSVVSYIVTWDAQLSGWITPLYIHDVQRARELTVITGRDTVR